MRPIKWYLKQRWTHTIFLNKDLVPLAALVVRQALPVLGNALYISQHHHHYHYGCPHGGVGLPLYSAQVRDGAIQRPLDIEQKPQLHITVLELGEVHLTLLHLEQEVLS